MGMAAIGAIAGSMKDESESRSGLKLMEASSLEKLGLKTSEEQLKGLTGLTEAGPGQSDVKAGVGSQRDLAAMLEAYSKGGFLPSQADFSTANQFAQSAMAPQQTAINQQFQQEQVRAKQLAAQLGRPANDPIIQSRLSQERQQAQERLGASQSAYSSEFALSLPQQRLGYAAQLSDVRSSLASQAMANRQTLLSLGSSLAENERAFRLNTAERWGTQSSGGGLKGALLGGIAGAGVGMKMGGLMAGIPSFGGGEEGTAPKGPMYGPENAPAGYQMQAAQNVGAGVLNRFQAPAPQQRINSHQLPPNSAPITYGTRGGFGMPMDYGTSIPMIGGAGNYNQRSFNPNSPYAR